MYIKLGQNANQKAQSTLSRYRVFPFWPCLLWFRILLLLNDVFQSKDFFQMVQRYEQYDAITFIPDSFIRIRSA